MQPSNAMCPTCPARAPARTNGMCRTCPAAYGAGTFSGTFRCETQIPNVPREPQPPRGASRPEQIAAGDVFGSLTALESAGRDRRGRLRWCFRCSCGATVTWNVATVTYNVRRLGFCACPACYVAAGGWREIARRDAADSASSAPPRFHGGKNAVGPETVGRHVGRGDR